jgi:predicted alpha/beta-fold hydrolase
VHGHFWTIAPHLRDRFSKGGRGAFPWSARLADQRGKDIEISGLLRDDVHSERLVVMVHGLGGHAASGYMRRMDRVLEAMGIATLRLNLRGADRRGAGFYHAGLVDDVEAALASPEAKQYSRRALLGFSLGGHISLRLAATRGAAVDALATICAPFDLAAGQRWLDQPARAIYRGHVLRGLKEMYRATSKEDVSLASYSEVASVKTIREWDRLTICPRFGFDSPDHYYREMSVGPILGRVDIPALIVAAEQDPMVPHHTLMTSLAQRSPTTTVHWHRRGGHVGFPFPMERDVGGWLKARLS